MFQDGTQPDKELTKMTSTETTEQSADAQAVIDEAQQVVEAKEAKIKASRQLDQDLRMAARAATDSLAMVAMLVQQAQEQEIWKVLTDAKGRAYKSWHGYITEILTESFEPLAAANRNALLKVLLDSGLSQRAAATIAKTSPATANRVAKGSSTGERKPRPKPNPGEQQQRRSLSTRVFEFLDQVSNRIDEIATPDLENLDKKLGAVHKQVQANLKLRHENSPSKAPRKQPMPPTKVTAQRQRQATKRRHPAGTKKPADAA